MKKYFFGILGAAVAASCLLVCSGNVHTQGKEQGAQAASAVKKAAGQYQEAVGHQVLVRFEKCDVQIKKGFHQKKLEEVKKKDFVSDDFGAVMGAVKKSSEIASTVSSQEKILSGVLGDDYIIEDSISFDDHVVSLVSSKTEDTDNMIKKLEKCEGVKYAVPNYLIHSESADYSLNDPYMEYCYPLADETVKNQSTGKNTSVRGTIHESETKDSSMHVTDVWQSYQNQNLNQEKIVVAILDTGIDYYHEELLGHMWENPGNIGLVGTYGYDFVDNDDDPLDEHGHGTHCAGIIAAKADNGQGISGVLGKYADDRVKLMALRVFDKKGAESTEFSVLGAFRYILTAVENGVNVRVASNSWGTDGGAVYGGIFDEVISELGKKGVLTFFAAGNSGVDLDQSDGSPASSTSDYMVCVGSVNERGDKASYSNYGKSQVDFFAPGSNILSSVSYDNYLPVIYTKEQLEKTTKTYGLFSGNSLTPVTVGAEVSSFGAPVVLDQDGKEIKEGVKLSVSGERYKNTQTKNSLKVEITEAKEDEIYYIFFPYQTEKKADGTNVLVAGSVGVPYDFNLVHQGYIGVADMLRYEDGAIRRPLVSAQSYNSTASDYDLYDFTSSDTFSYTEAKAASSHGIAVLYKAEKTAPATLYIDGLAVSRAGVKSSSLGKYDFMSGTSMACPNAAGAAALLLAGSPEILENRTEEGTLALKNLLLSCVRKTEKLKGFCETDGVLDLSKVTSRDLEPVVSSVKVDTENDTVTLCGVNFGNELGELSVVHTMGGEQRPVAADEILSWEEKKIVLKDTVKSNHCYTFRGNYLTFYIKTKAGKENDNTFYVSAGAGGFQTLGKSLLLGNEEKKYAGLVSDGSEVYGITNVGSVYRIDVKTGERMPYLSIKSALELLSEEGYYETLGIDKYELSHNFLVSVKGNPVCMNGFIYEWLLLTASDRTFYLGLKLDVTMAHPEWKIIAVDVDPYKNGYKKIPQVFLFDGAAVCEYKGKIYAAGGHSPKGQTLGSFLVYVFDPDTEEWQYTKLSLPGSVFGLRMEESHGRLYAFLGGTAYSLSADIKQPDKRIFCFDGNEWKKLDVEIPFFIKTYQDDNGMVFANVTTAVTGRGIFITGASTDGYGDTFLLNTEQEDSVSFQPLNQSFYSGLSTGEDKFCAETVIQTEDGEKKDAVVVLSEEIEDNIQAYCVHLSQTGDEDTQYYSVDFRKKGSGKGNIYGLKRVKKYEGYKERFTVVPDEKSVISSVTADGKKLQPVSENVEDGKSKESNLSGSETAYEFVPEKDTEVVVTLSAKEDRNQTSTVKDTVKKASKARLKIKKKSLKKGSTYQIKVVNKNGQSVQFSISKKTKKRGVSVTAKGKIKVKKKAKAGTYYAVVSIKANSKYKAKKLNFRITVKK